MKVFLETVYLVLFFLRFFLVVVNLAIPVDDFDPVVVRIKDKCDALDRTGKKISEEKKSDSWSEEENIPVGNFLLERNSFSFQISASFVNVVYKDSDVAISLTRVIRKLLRKFGQRG